MENIGLPEILVIFGVVFMLALAMVLLVRALRSKQARSVQRALIDRLPPEEILRLMEKPEGARVLQALADSGASPVHSILSTVRSGIVVVVTASGLFGGAALTPFPAPLFGLAILLECVGIGLLLAAFATYRLSKRWGLIDRGRYEPSTGRES